MKKIQFIFITLFLLTTSLFSSSFSLSIDKRLAGEADTRGGIFFDNGSIFVSDHHDGLWKSDIDGIVYGDTTGSDDELYDIWKYNSNLFAVGKKGFFIYDTDGNHLNSVAVSGNALYIQNGFAYVTNDSGGISIIDISDVNNPMLTSTILTGQNFLHIRGNALFGDGKSSGAGDAIYITDASGNLYRFDDDKNGTLTLNSSITPFIGEARQIFVHSDGTLYVSNDNGKLAIVSADLTTTINWTNPSATSHSTSSAPVSGGVFVSTINGVRYAFITAYDGYIYTLDVTDYANIIVVDTYIDADPYKFNDIWVENSKIYATSHDGFLILDIVIPPPSSCLGTFPGPLNSTADAITLSNNVRVNNTDNNTIVTNILNLAPDVECDAAPCVATTSLADAQTVTVELGLGVDGSRTTTGGTTEDFNTSKEYIDVNIGNNTTLNFTGDSITKVQTDFLVGGGSTVNINGDITIYANNFEMGTFCNINIISGSLKIIANTVSLNSGNEFGGVVHPEDLVVYATGDISISTHGNMKGLFYAGGHVDIYSGNIVTGSVTGKSIDLGTNAVVYYDPIAVNAYCGSPLPTNGISGTITDKASGTPISGAKVYLYADSKTAGVPTKLDKQAAMEITGASGAYNFDVESGVYFVLVDSTSLHSDANVSMEQTHGPAGGYCADGIGGIVTRATAGVCYGGKEGDTADIASDIETAEHIAIVDLNSTPINDVDFGFNANVVTNVNDSGQGSLRAFIQNANIITGANEMQFVPTVPENSATWWTISPISALPALLDSGTTIDGTAYMLDANLSVRDTNVGLAGGNFGMELGTGADGIAGSGDEPMLEAFDKKELEIDIDNQFLYGIKVENDGISNITIKNIAIFGAKDETATIDENSDILVSDGATNIDISYNFVGIRADGSVPTTPVNQSDAYGITLIEDNNTISSFSIHHNYVGHIGGQGIYVTGAAVSGGDIYQNEVFHAYRIGDWLSDGIAAENGVSDINIYENYVHDNNGPGFESWEAKGNIRWTNNTSFNNGHNPDGNPNSIEDYGLRSMGDDNIIEKNLIYGNAGAGVVVAMYEDSNKTAQRSVITQNSIYNNGKISIDLDQTNGDGSNAIGDGVTPNNDTKNPNLQNSDMDFPLFSKVTFDGTILTATGYVGVTEGQAVFASSRVEIYKVEDDGDINGEGRWYLGSCNTNVDGNFSCSFTAPVEATLILGDTVTATATDDTNSTSEFGPNQLVESANTFSCDQEAYIFSSLAIDQQTDSYLIDIAGNSYTTGKLNMHGSNINAIGYNIVDNYIWGFDRNNKDVVRVDNTYTVAAIPKVIGLPSVDFHIGDVSPDGVLYMTARNATIISRVDVNPNNITYGEKLADLTVTAPIKAADFAFSTKDNMLYYVSDDEYLMRINPTDGTSTNLGEMDMPALSEVHSAFFDKDGFMYAFHGGHNYVYKFAIPLTAVVSPAKISTKTFAHIELGSQGDGARCANAPMDTTPTLSITPTFDVIDGGLGYAPDANITTKMVGADFNLTILSQDLNNSAALKDVNITRLDLYDCSNGIVSSPWWSGPTQTTNISGYTEIVGLSVDSAQKCLKVKVFGTYDGNVNISDGVDDFAVRPVNFSIASWGATTHAGSDFSLQVQAENSAGTATPNYNEGINSSFKIEAKENNISCNGGDLNVTGALFSEGDLAHVSTTYSNTGDINIRVSEINGSEFAVVDSDDTPDAQRLIGSDDINHTFIPYQFVLDWNLTNNDNLDFTYFADDPALVAAELSLSVVPENEGGDPTDNYKKGCSANDVDITISFDTDGSAGSNYILQWEDDNGTNGTDFAFPPAAGTFTYTIGKDEFATGELSKTIQLNFARTQNVPKEPLEFSVSDVEVKDTIYVTVDGNLTKVDENSTFYFGRLHAPDYSVMGDTMSARIYYEVYCKSCDQTKFLLAGGHESVDSVNWYVIDHTEVGVFNNVDSLHDSIVTGTNSSDTISLQVPKLSHKNRITYDPVSWLRYNEFSPTAEPHAFNVAFSSDRENWAGQGELGRTVDMNVSKELRLQKIDW